MKYDDFSYFPTYNETDNLPVLHDCLNQVVSQLPGYEFEFIFVDDCSIDRTPDILEALRKKDTRVNIIRFSRNYGPHAAVAAGLAFCNGDAAVKMAADLQDPPELIPELIRQWQKGYKVVWGTRKKRLGEKFSILAFSRIYYFIMNLLSNVKQPPSGADIALLDRIVIDAFNQCNEKNTSNNMLIAWLGFSQTYIEYTKKARHSGDSKWTFFKRIKLFLDSLISFSYIPLRLISLTGFLLSTAGILYSIRIFYNKIVKGTAVMGWTSLMVAILIIGGFQMIMTGMLGEYLWRTYDETRKRPKYIIEKNTLLENRSTLINL